jgi:hypothetical protein
LAPRLPGSPPGTSAGAPFDDPFRRVEGATVIQLGELIMILDLHRQGLSVSAIARRVGIDRKMVRARPGAAELWSAQAASAAA